MMDTVQALVANNIGLAASASLLLAVILVLVGISTELFRRSDVEERLRAAPLSWTGQVESGPARTSAVGQLFRYVESNFDTNDAKKLGAIQKDLLAAGFFGRSAVAWFYFARIVGTVVLAIVGFLYAVIFMPQQPLTVMMLGALLGGMLGLVLPKIYIDRRAKAVKQTYTSGFPDFLDLLVVATESGLSVEGAIMRVSGEIAETYPALGANLHMMTLEMRAGRAIQDALQSFAERVQLPEVKAFATLVRQSAELGTGLADALRVYSDDMRHQRLSRAEERANGLPAKLVLPLGLFVFPVVLVVIMVPIAIRLLKVMT
ncbi:type II secretion system F family protein [Prosthecomicrobium sp. N25]|uniref:type II secretion system F family protein n=1 Tax=Prosthecomicrobium sp. N25 TaxID=3129254 RepID=UPI0030788EF7